MQATFKARRSRQAAASHGGDQRVIDEDDRKSAKDRRPGRQRWPRRASRFWPPLMAFYRDSLLAAQVKVTRISVRLSFEIRRTLAADCRAAGPLRTYPQLQV
jgi:hypothetical protein